MIREEIERVHKEPIITNTAFDIAVDKAFLELLHDNKPSLWLAGYAN